MGIRDLIVLACVEIHHMRIWYEDLVSRTLAGASEPSRTSDWELGIVCWAHPMEHRIRGFLDVCVDRVSGVPVWPMSRCLD